MSSISKTKKTYIISYYFNGKKVRRSLKVDTHKEALTMQKNYDGLIKEGVNPDSMYREKSISEIPNTLDELVEEYLLKITVTENTMISLKQSLECRLMINEESKIEGILKPGTLLNNISSKTVDLIYDELKKRYSQNSQNSIAAHFKMLFNFAVDRGYLKVNPMNLVKRFPKQVQAKLKTYSDEEIDKIEKYIKDKRWFKILFR